jgi:hypothetical protein
MVVLDFQEINDEEGWVKEDDCLETTNLLVLLMKKS